MDLGRFKLNRDAFPAAQRITECKNPGPCFKVHPESEAVGGVAEKACIGFPLVIGSVEEKLKV